MSQALNSRVSVSVTVLEILPKLGLAYLSDDNTRTWAATRSTPGIDFASLHVGDRLHAEVGEFRMHSVVQRCRKSE